MTIANLSNFEILWLTIIGEARGEPIESQVGVGNVVNNRYKIKHRGKLSIAAVCLDPLQFSCWNPNDPNRKILDDLSGQLGDGLGIRDPHFRQCRYVANGIMSGDIKDNTAGSLYYLEESLFYSSGRPAWSNNIAVQFKLGHHMFFRLKGEK